MIRATVAGISVDQCRKALYSRLESVMRKVMMIALGIRPTFVDSENIRRS